MEAVMAFFAAYFWWIVLAVFLFGSGIAETTRRIFDGRRKLAVTKAQLKSAQAEIKRMEQREERRALTPTPETPAEKLVESARNALDERAELLDLLGQVQASDRAFPQLPQELRDDIDAGMARFRRRSRTPVEEP